MDDKIKDYLMLGGLLLLNIALWFLNYWLESNMSRLSNPSVVTLTVRYFTILAIPSILAFKLISYYDIMRYSIVSLAVLDIIVVVILGKIGNSLTLSLLGLLLCWHIALYLLSVRKEKKQILEEKQSVE